MLNYFSLIHRYIPPDSLTYRLYLPHVVLVTQKALSIAARLNLNAEQIRFIEEAAMLHDIGICQVDAPELGCTGNLPYIQHGLAGQKILEAASFPIHAQVASHHTGVGITKSEIESENLELPPHDFIPVNIEQEIIAYSDIWFSKNPAKLWHKYTVEEVKQWLSRYPDSESKLNKFDGWREKFE